jgi:hypothetical protein
MLTAEGFMPVAPVWGRSEEEMALRVLPVACPRGEALLSTIFWHNPHTDGRCRRVLGRSRSLLALTPGTMTHSVHS